MVKTFELKAANEKLRQEIARLNREQVGSMKYMTEAEESLKKEIPEFDPQKMKALAELANHLR